MIVIWLTVIFTVILISILLYVFLSLKRKLDKNEKGSRNYTYLTMYALMVSLIMAALMLISLISTVFVAELNNEMYKEQLKRDPTINPDIQVSLTNNEYNKFLATFNLASVERGIDGNSSTRKNAFEFWIVNNGQRPVFLNAYLRDENRQYHSSISRLFIDKLNSTSFQLDFWHKNCTNELKQYDFNTAFRICQDVASKIRLGIEEFLLILDCPGCWFDEGQERCYSFNVCVYNNSVGEDECEKLWSESGYVYSKIEKTICPKNWRFSSSF